MIRPDAAPAISTDQADLPTTRQAIAALLPDLRAFARFLVRDPVAADDLVQDAVVRALGAIAQFRPGTNLKAWLFTILRNAFYEQIRRHRRETAMLRAQVLTEEGAPPQQAIRGEIDDLNRLLWRLSPRLREALVLVGAQELSHEEAAAICGVPVGTMKARLSRARAELVQLHGGQTTGRGIAKPADAGSRSR